MTSIGSCVRLLSDSFPIGHDPACGVNLPGSCPEEVHVLTYAAGGVPVQPPNKNGIECVPSEFSLSCGFIFASPCSTLGYVNGVYELGPREKEPKSSVSHQADVAVIPNKDRRATSSRSIAYICTAAQLSPTKFVWGNVNVLTRSSFIFRFDLR